MVTSVSRRLSGKEFQAVGPATAKARRHTYYASDQKWTQNVEYVRHMSMSPKSSVNNKINSKYLSYNIKRPNNWLQVHTMLTITHGVPCTRHSIHRNTVFLTFNGHFPGEPGLDSFIEAKNDESGGDNWSSWYMQISSQIVITNKPSPTFYRPDALPVAQPTVSKHWRETKTFSNANAMKRSSKHFEIMHTHHPLSYRSRQTYNSYNLQKHNRTLDYKNLCTEWKECNNTRNVPRHLLTLCWHVDKLVHFSIFSAFQLKSFPWLFNIHQCVAH